MGARDALPSHKDVAKLAMVLDELRARPLVGLSATEFRESGGYLQFQFAVLMLGVAGWAVPELADEEFNILSQRTRLLDHETPEKALAWLHRLLKDEEAQQQKQGTSPLLTSARDGSLLAVANRLRQWPRW